MIGQTIGGYQLREPLGSGGMGTVFKAHDARLDRPAILKLFPQRLGVYQEAVGRFIEDTKAVSALNHPNICRIYDVGKFGAGQVFVATAYDEGETLQQKLARGQLPVSEALDYFRQIVEGLAEAHQRGHIHYHLKPANVLVTHDGTVKLLDIGMIQTPLADQMQAGAGQAVPYFSPEQVRGHRVDQRTDVWSSGVILYEMLTGETPFRGDDTGMLVSSIVKEELKRITMLQPAMPGILEEVITKALAKNPSERYSQAIEMLNDLKQLDALPTKETDKEAAEALEPVRLGTSAPQAVRPGDEFTARLAAYAPEEEELVGKMLRELSPDAKTDLRPKNYLWSRGTRITARLSGRRFEIDEPEQDFVWEGKHEVLDFTVSVPDAVPLRRAVLTFGLYIDGLPVTRPINLDVEITNELTTQERTTTVAEPIRTAFASYASKDALRVLDMVSVLRSKAGMDIFWDRYSLVPGEYWEKRLREEIRKRDAFYLFWSPHARASHWVEIEWKTALKEKGLGAIQPQPLVPVTEAPPPEELKSLHFNDAYMLIRKALERPS